MNEYLISVIVPVYNMKEYLGRCVDSLLDQTFKNLQILLVDDGSTDGSALLCDKLELRDDRITALHINVIAEHRSRAEYFRKLVMRTELIVPQIPLSGSCTPVLFPGENATAVYEALRSKYNIYLTPSGGEWKDRLLRVGHMGNLTMRDYDDLMEKLETELSELHS